MTEAGEDVLLKRDRGGLYSRVGRSESSELIKHFEEKGLHNRNFTLQYSIPIRVMRGL